MARRTDRNCADCGDRLQSGLNTYGELVNVTEIRNCGPIRCNSCLIATELRVEAVVDRIGPLLFTSLWA
jgi:hypothetical protein